MDSELTTHDSPVANRYHSAGQSRPPRRGYRPPAGGGLHRFAIVMAIATASLVFVGGTVTSNDAGLAVPDWPTTFGENMFLYPPSKWVGDVLYEHGHRLTGSLVGMLAIIMTIWAHLRERRRWVKRLTWIILAAVTVQGVMGGLRVTERSIALAIVHGCFAQLFLCATVCMVVVTSRGWVDVGRTHGVRPVGLVGRRTIGGGQVPGRWLRRLCVATAAIVFCQVIAGAVYRHLGVGLAYHIAGAVLVMFVICSAVLGVSRDHCDDRLLMRIAKVLGTLLIMQLVLGVWTYVATLNLDVRRAPGFFEWFVPSAHVAVGGLFLACSVALVLGVHRRPNRWTEATPCGGAVVPCGGATRVSMPLEGVSAV